MSIANFKASSFPHPYAQASARSKSNSIRLRRLPSLDSQASQPTLPPYTTPSSSTSSLPQYTPPLQSSATFNSTSTLRIQALGKGVISLPKSSNELSIPIVNADGQQKYISVRPNRRSGSCALYVSPYSKVEEEDSKQDLILSQTTYKFGPGNSPTIKLYRGKKGSEELKISSPSLVSRRTRFLSTVYGEFEWRYANRKERALIQCPSSISTCGPKPERPNNVLLLERITLGEECKEQRLLVARMMRGDGTRTEGSTACAAGNGGLLEMCLDYASDIRSKNENEGEKDREIISEAAVLSTLLVMLKMEVDRLRVYQIMTIGGMAS